MYRFAISVVIAALSLITTVSAETSAVSPTDKGPSVRQFMTRDGRIDINAVRSSGYQGPLDLKGVDMRVDPRGGAPTVSASTQFPTDDPDDQYWDNSISPSMPGLDGPVKAMIVFDGKLIVAGAFGTAGGTLVNGIVAWDGISFSPLGSGIGGGSYPIISTLTVYDGKLVAGGNFTTAGGDSSNNIASWDGAVWSPLGSGTNGWVGALSVFDGKLIAGGAFTTAGGDSANRIAAWDGNSWLPLASGADGNVSALMVYDGKLIAGGEFSTAGGVSVLSIASWDGSAWSPVGEPIFSAVSALTVYDGKLIAGGYSETNMGGVLAWDGIGWSGFGMGGTATALTVYDNKLVMSSSGCVWMDGCYTDINVWDDTIWRGLGGVWKQRPYPWSEFPPGQVSALTSYEGKLIVGGDFAGVGGAVVNYIASSDGNRWSSLRSEINGGVTAVTLYDGKLIAGGHFTTIGGVTGQGVASWDGSSWSSLGLGVAGGNQWSPPVNVLTVYEGKLIAAGNFTTAGGDSASNLASWDGINWSPLGSGIGGTYPTVSALTVYDGKLIAGGSFTTAGGDSASNIASWDGTAWSPLGSGTDGRIYAVSVFSGKLIAGGAFTTAGGDSANRVAAWDGSSWNPLGSGMNVEISTLITFDGKLIAGGSFTTAGGVLAHGVASWNGNDWSPLGDGVGTQYERVNALTVYNGRLIAGGYFSTAGGVAANSIAAWDGSSWSPLGSGISGGADLYSGPVVFALTTYDETLIVGGFFTTAGDKTASFLAQWSANILPYAGTQWHVSMTGSDSWWGGNGSTERPFRTPNRAIAASQSGDTILVTAGTYGMECLDLFGKGVLLKSADGPENTTLQISQPLQFHSGEDTAAVIDGFSIAGNIQMTDSTGPRIVNNRITGRILIAGGSNPVIQSNTIAGGQAERGGGIEVTGGSNPVIQSNTITGGQAMRGGAIFITEASSPRIMSNFITDNKVSNSLPSWQRPFAHGGAIYCDAGSSPTISFNVFLDNEAKAPLSGQHFPPWEARGGAIYCEDAIPLLEGNVFARNRVYGEDSLGQGFGGAVYLRRSKAVLTNNTFVSNSTQFSLGQTIHGYGGGVYCDSSSVSVANCLFAFNNGGGLYGAHLSVGTHEISCSNIYGNECEIGDWEAFPGKANISGNKSIDPQFCDTASGDYHLTSSSPCAPANNAGTLIGALDVGCSPSDVADDGQDLPVQFALSQNYPNPFNPVTMIEFSLPEQAIVTVEVFNILGQRVRTLVNEARPAGIHKVEWNGTADNGNPVGSGVYFYRFMSSDVVQTRKMLLLK